MMNGEREDCVSYAADSLCLPFTIHHYDLGGSRQQRHVKFAHCG